MPLIFYKPLEDVPNKLLSGMTDRWRRRAIFSPPEISAAAAVAEKKIEFPHLHCCLFASFTITEKSSLTELRYASQDGDIT